MPESDDNSNWEDSSVSDQEEEPTTKAVIGAAKTAAKAHEEFVIPAKLAKPRSNPSDERKRLEKIALLRDKALSGNIFGDDSSESDSESDEGSVEVDAKTRVTKLLKGAKVGTAKQLNQPLDVSADPFSRLQLQRMQDVDALCDTLCPRIQSSSAKSPAWLRLMDRLLMVCAAKMEPQDLLTLQKKVQSAHTERKRSQNFQLTSSKKGTDLKVDIRNPRAELDIADGLGFSDDEDDVSEGSGYQSGLGF